MSVAASRLIQNACVEGINLVPPFTESPLSVFVKYPTFPSLFLKEKCGWMPPPTVQPDVTAFVVPTLIVEANGFPTRFQPNNPPLLSVTFDPPEVIDPEFRVPIKSIQCSEVYFTTYPCIIVRFSAGEVKTVVQEPADELYLYTPNRLASAKTALVALSMGDDTWMV